MSDDFGTVNVRRGDRAREIEILRQRYRSHREALGRMIADAPTEQLAAEYQRLIASVDESLRKLDELEGRPAAQPVQSMTSPGTRQLSPEPVTEPQKFIDDPPPATAGGGSRTLLIVVVGVLVLGAAAYFGLIRPKKAEAARLQKETDAAKAQIDAYYAKSAAVKGQPKIRSADLFRLAEAFPSQADMSGVLLQLNQIAADTGITFQSIAPQTSVPISGYQAMPIQLTFQGNFYNLADFLFRLRNLVGVQHGQLSATGRLFAIDTLSFSQAQEGFPQIAATLVVDAFVYGTQTTATATPTTTTATTGTTTGATTTSSTPPVASGATAAGAPSG